MLKYRVRQIYYKPSQVGFIDPTFEGFFNTGLDKFFENGVIKKMFMDNDHEGGDYYGVVSWKFRQKTGYNGDLIQSLIAMNGNVEDTDVFVFNKNFKKNNVWVVGENWHADFVNVGNAIFNKLGFDIDVSELNTEPIYYNYWIIKTALFKKYCNDLLLPAMELMNTDKEIMAICDRNANYTGQNVMKAQQCMEVFGKPFYTYYPFVLERFMSTFAAIHELKILQI